METVTAEQQTQDHSEPLLRAVMNGDDAQLRNILKEENYGTAGGPDLTTHRWLDLQSAIGYCAHHTSRIVTVLMEFGLDPNVIAVSHGRTALGSALVMRDDLATVIALIQGGADVNKAGADGATPLHWCVRKGRVEAARLLLEHGAAIDIRDQQGRTVVEMAQWNHGTQSDLALMFQSVQENDALRKRAGTRTGAAHGKQRPGTVGKQGADGEREDTLEADAVSAGAPARRRTL